MPTVNKFLETEIAGNFYNIDHPSNTNILANGSFARDLTIKGNIFIGNEKLVDTVYTNSGGNFCFKINNVDYTITPLMLSYLLNLTGDINTSLFNKANVSYVNTEISNISTTLIDKADTSYVNTQIANLVNSSPTTLDTLNELAMALGNDPNFATTITNALGNKADTSNMNSALALKANIASPTFTGIVGGISKSMVGLSNVDNTSDLSKVVSNATTIQLNLKAPINNPQFTGVTYFQNTSAFTMLNYASQQFGAICTNLTGGHAELDFINTGRFNTNMTIAAFNWYIYTSTTTKTLLMTLFNSGNVSFVGTIDSPTITTINNTLLLKSDKTYVDTTFGTIANLALKSDKTYVDTTFGTITNLSLKSDKTYVDGTFGTIANLALKSDKSYVDTGFNDLQYQINQLPTTDNISNKADISYCDSTFATITNLNLKADSNTPTLTKPTVLNHLLFNGSVSAFPTWSSVNSGAIYGQSKYLLFVNINTDTANSTLAFKWQKMYNSGAGNDIMTITNNGNLYVLGNITSPTIISLQNQIDLKATITNLNLKANITDMNLKANITDMNLKANITDMNLKANITDMNLKANITDMNLKADITMVNDGLALKVNKTYADLNYANVNILNNATFPMNLYISSTAGSTLDGNIYIKDNTSNYVRIFAVGSSAYYDAYNAFKVRMTALNGNVVSTAIDINAVGDITLNNIISPTITAINNTLTSINSLLSGVTSNIQNQFNSITSTIANYATSFTTQTLYYDRRIGRTSVMNVSRTHTFSDLPEYISVNISGLTLTLPEITNLTQNGSVVYVFLNGGNFSVTINVTNQQIRYGGSNINNQNNFVFSQGGVCKRFVAINNLWTIFED